MTRRSLTFALAAVMHALLSLHAVVSVAQEVAPSTGTDLQALDPAYEAAIRAGVEAQDAGDFARAHDEFERAHTLYPNARALRAMAIASYRERQFRRAAQEIEAALSHPEKALDARLREGAIELLARARRELGEVSVAVTAPQAAEVTVDDEGEVRSTREPLWLEPGPHTLHVRAPGMIPQQLTLEARPGTRLELHVALAAEGAAQPPLGTTRVDAAPTTARAEPMSAAQRAHRRRVFGAWASASVATLAGGAALGTYLLGRQRIESIDELCRSAPGGGCTAEEKRAQARDANLPRLERALDASLVIALGSTAAAVAIVTWDYHASGKRFTLWVSSDAVMLRGRF